MAMFGNLSDIPPTEVFAMLGRRSGKLHFQLPHGNENEVHLREGVLWSLRINGLSAHDGGTFEVGLGELLKQREGSFEFFDLPPEELEHRVDFTQQALLQIVARAEDETAQEGNRIPDKDTRFELKDSSSDGLPPNLSDFITQSKSLLETKSSAAEIAEALGVPTMRAQMYLVRLRAYGKIAPVRAYATSHRASIPPTQQPVKLSVKQELTPNRAVAAPQRPALVTAKHTAYPARRGFVKRLLAAITPGGHL